jgi:hypothetical protein
MRYALIAFEPAQGHITQRNLESAVGSLFNNSGMKCKAMVVGEASDAEAYLKSHPDNQLKLPFEKSKVQV